MPKKTPLYNKHIEYNAKMVEFADFLMPIQYTGIISEVNLVREKIGVFDVSHMGEIEITGSDALKFVNYITINDASKLEEMQVQYSAMCYPDGGIVDDLLVYRLPDKYLLVVNATNIDKDFEWIMKNKQWDMHIENKSDTYFQLAIQGPIAEEVVQKIVDIDLSPMKFYWSGLCKINNKDMLISRTGYTGEDGFEIYGANEYGEDVWNLVFSAGKDRGIGPAGLGARDTLRLEMKYCLYGNDIDKTTNPLEAGLGWITKLDKEDFIAKNILIKQKQEGVNRKLVGFEMKNRLIPRHHYKIYKDGNEIGRVTSGTFSPSINKTVGLGYISTPFSKVGTEIEIEIRGKMEKAKIVKMPFYKNATHK